MPKYRVKEVVGELRHGVGKELKTYRAGEVIELSEEEATRLHASLEPVGKKGNLTSVPD